MATAPLVVLLYDCVFEFESVAAALRARRMLYAGLAATWVELAVIMWRWPRSTVGLDAVSPLTYLLNQAEIVPHYLTLVLWPRALILDYGLPRVLTIGDVVPGLVLLLVLVASAAYAFVRWPKPGFLAAAFFITLAPTSSVIPIASEAGAERRMYLPLAALAILIVVGGRAAIDRWQLAKPMARRGLLAVAAIAVALLAVRTWLRNAEFADPLTLWQTVVERRPHGRARMAYGSELMLLNRHDEALAQLRAAVADFPNARAALGTELLVSGHPDEAAREFRTFIAQGPTLANRIPAQQLLVRALTEQGRLDEAAAELRRVMAVLPNDQMAQQSRATLGYEYRKKAEGLLKSGDVDGAMIAARQALALNAKDGEAHNLLGAALATRGRLEEAIAEFQEAVSINPIDQRAANNLSHALALRANR